MQDWRFDDLTRTLGSVTSRRGVLKGLLGGLGAAVLGRALPSRDAEAASGCSSPEYQTCMDNASDQYGELKSQCSTTDGPPIGGSICLLLATATYARATARCRQRFANCPPGEQCVNNRCCRPGNCCQAGEVSCPGPGPTATCCPAGSTCCAAGCCAADNTCCLEIDTSGFAGFFNPSASQVCADLQTNPKHCGNCRTNCGDQPCTHGHCGCGECARWDENTRQCVPINDGGECDGGTCCKGTCIPACPGGQPPDPTTCQCHVCQNQIDGAACDATNVNLACCHEQCVNIACPSGKTWSFQTCSCQCSATCPPGQLQDPETCQCQDLCQHVTCGTCQTCDPTSGDCVQAADNTDCGNGNICCQGACVAGPTCSGVCQGQTQGTPCGPEGYCCVNDTTCHNPVDTIGYDNHCCLQYDVWCSVLGTCTSGADCCQAMGQGAYCGSTEHNEPICCGGGNICCTGGYFFPGSSGTCAPNESSCS
jgi:hypothetical protein